MKQTTIIQAIRSRELFGCLPKFKKLDSWQAWLIALKSVFGLPLTADDMTIFERCTGRSVPPTGAFREVFFIVGRRGGKSFMTAVIACFVACFTDFRPFITVGETLAILCLAVDKMQSRIVFRYIRAILNAVPSLKAMIVVERADEIELNNGVTIMVKAADFGSLRGFTVPLVICDEIAFWPSEGCNPDDAILGALRPSMATIPNAKMVCISTGYSQFGTLYDSWKRYFGQNVADVLVWQSDTITMNPTISQSFVDAEIARDPEANRAEYLGLFRENIVAAFSLEMIERCIIPGRAELLPNLNTCGGYYAFCDPSGGRHDSFTLAVAHNHHHDDLVVLDVIRERRAPFDPAEVTKEYAEFLKLYGINSVVGDNYGGEWPVAEFAKNGIGYSLSEKHKSQLYLSLIPMLTSKKVELLQHEKMTTELRRLERTRSRSGLEKIDHGPHGSDDVCNAVAGAIDVAYSGQGGSIDDLLTANYEYPAHRTMDPGRSWIEQRAFDEGSLFARKLW